MNFSQIRQLVVLIFVSYTLALSVVWNNLSGFWSKVRPKSTKKAIESAQIVEKAFDDSWLFSLQLPKLELSPKTISSMYARGVPLFGGRPSDEMTSDTDTDTNNSAHDRFGGPMLSDWVAGPRDESTLPRIIMATQSSTREEVDYAFSEMIKILERIDIESNYDVIEKALEVVVDFCEDSAQTEEQCGQYLSCFPFLFELTSSTEAWKAYKSQMEVYLAVCLESGEEYRRHAVYTTGVLLERNVISSVALKRVIIPKLFELALDSNMKDEQRAEIATILCRFSTQCTLERSWLFDHYIWRYSKFLTDSVVHVRKAAVMVFGALAELFGTKFTEMFIIPHLIALSDDMNWGIRKVVTEIFVEVSKHSSPHVRKTVLAPRFIKLLEDPSRWVTYQAFQELGPFISTFADSNLTGLHLKDGQVFERKESDATAVVVDPSSSSGIFKEYEFDDLPMEIAMPESPCESEVDDGDLTCNNLQAMLENWDINKLRISPQSAPPSVSGEEQTASGSGSRVTISVAAKCSSYENLADMDLYDSFNEDSFMEDPCGEDDEEPMESSPEANGTTTPKEDEVMTDLTYWAPEYISVGVDEEQLIAFGVSNDMRKTDILTRRLDVLYRSPTNNSSGSSSSGSPRKNSSILSNGSDLDVTISDPAEVTNASSSSSTVYSNGSSNSLTPPKTDATNTSFSFEDGDDLIRDCRGIDEDEEAMETEAVSHIGSGGMFEIVPKELVENYLAMVTTNMNQLGSDINRYCAHNFPAVAFTMGRESWPQLKEAYVKLATDDQFQRVRVSIATSIHEMARIIGPQSADEDLLPIFNSYREDSPELRVAILKNLYEFYTCLSEEKRKTMIEVLPEFMPVDNSELTANWRYRLEFARQCRKLCDLYGIEEVNRTISAIALTLANDRIADVRKEAVHLVVEIIRRLVENEWPKMAPGETADEESSKETLTEQLIQDIVSGFAKTQKWTRRQTFANICMELLDQNALNQEQFRFFLLPHIVAMASDRVPNVRISVCRVLRRLDGDLRPIPLGNETTRSVADFLEKLADEEDLDVSNEARFPDGKRIGPLMTKGRELRIREKEEEVFGKSRQSESSSDTSKETIEATTPPHSGGTASTADSPVSIGVDPLANYEVADMDIASSP